MKVSTEDLSRIAVHYKKMDVDHAIELWHQNQAYTGCRHLSPIVVYVWSLWWNGREQPPPLTTDYTDAELNEALLHIYSVSELQKTITEKCGKFTKKS